MNSLPTLNRNAFLFLILFVSTAPSAFGLTAITTSLKTTLSTLTIGDNDPAPAESSSPVISSVMRVYATVGAPFAYSVSATHMMEADKPVNFTATGLPATLSFQTTPAKPGASASGMITGTFQGDPGTFTVTVRATNAAGTGSAPITIVVGAAGPGKGFFTTYKDKNGVWWFKDPKGNLVISKALDCFGIGFYRPLKNWDNFFGFVNAMATFGTEAKAELALGQLITGYNFNTIGAWSTASDGPVSGTTNALWVTPVPQFGSNFHGVNNFPDVFAPDFQSFAESFAQKQCATTSSDPWLVGYYIDNELNWGYEWETDAGNNLPYNPPTQLLLRFLRTPSSAGYAVAWKMLKDEYPDIAALNASWKTTYSDWSKLEAPGDIPCSGRPGIGCFNDCNKFVGMAAEKYFSITSAALKKADPNHLNLGCRFASGSHPLPAVLTAEAKYVDVISFNCYATDPTPDIQFYVKSTGNSLPVIIGEFSIRSKQNNSNAGNGGSSGPVVNTQAERAADFTAYVKAGMAHPYLIGYSWFDATDEPTGAQGNNYGIWDLNGKPYPELTKEMTETNGQAETLHAAAKSN